MYRQLTAFSCGATICEKGTGMMLQRMALPLGNISLPWYLIEGTVDEWAPDPEQGWALDA